MFESMTFDWQNLVEIFSLSVSSITTEAPSPTSSLVQYMTDGGIVLLVFNQICLHREWLQASVKLN